MIYNYLLNSVNVQTGDIICTTDGNGTFLPGQFWRLIGLLIPGDIDHIVIYIGPEGKCIEAGPKGVNQFFITDNVWNPSTMESQRGGIIDDLYGIAFPLSNKNLSASDELTIREAISLYCNSQLGKPYNINFFDFDTDKSFYCSQLAYKAYISQGINLNTKINIPQIPGTENIIYPEDIWASCINLKI